jgi:hypothetical protein
VDSVNLVTTETMVGQLNEQVEKEAAAENERLAAQRARWHEMKTERAKRQEEFAAQVLELVEEPAVEEVPSEKPAKPEKKDLLLRDRKQSIRNTMVLAQLSKEALKQVGSGGRWNWVLISPDIKRLPLLGGGSGGVDELRANAEQNQDLVMYALLRVVFNVPGFSQTRFLFLHIVGEDAPIVKRGRWNGLRPAFEKQFREFANIAASSPDTPPSALTPELLIAKMGYTTDYLVATDREGDSRAKVVAAYHESLAKEQTEAGKKNRPSESLVNKVKNADEHAQAGDTSGKSLKDMLAMIQESHAEDPDAEPEEEPLPYAGIPIKEVNLLVRQKRECNWALIRPAPRDQRRVK